MQYFLTMPHDSEEEPTMASMQEFDPEEFAAVIAAVDEFNSALRSAGAFLFAGGLQPPSTAKTVDATAENTRVTDAPFVEAASYVGGFWVIAAADDEEALRWATLASKAVQSRIEVRALQEEPSA